MILGGSSQLVSGVEPWLVSPQDLGLLPLQMAFSWLINGGDPNYLPGYIPGTQLT